MKHKSFNTISYVDGALQEPNKEGFGTSYRSMKLIMKYVKKIYSLTFFIANEKEPKGQKNHFF